MWVMTQNGFVSAVQDEKDKGILKIRARDKISLQSMLDHLSAAGENVSELKIVTGAGTDYRWRVLLPRDMFSTFLLSVADEIDYGNFKNRITKTRGKKFHDALMDVWVAMLKVDDGKVDRARPWDLAGRAIKR